MSFTLEKDPTRGMQNAGDCFSLIKTLSQPLFGFTFPFFWYIETLPYAALNLGLLKQIFLAECIV